MILADDGRAAPPMHRTGTGVEVGISFPFLASPPPAFFDGESPLSAGLREPVLRSPHDALVDAILRHLPGAAPSRVYVGSETCGRLIPSTADLEAWLIAASGGRWEVSLVLPPLERESQERALECLRVLSEVPDAEVVANDWGTVHSVRKRFPGISIVLGRLTHKTLRDPRLAEHFDSPGAPPGARSALCRSGELAPGYRELMKRYGIGRREIDPFLQPLENEEWEDRAEKLSVHLPYLFVTMGRCCLLGAMHREREDRFIAGAPCRRECRAHAIEFRLPDPAGNGEGKRLLELGNALYHAVPQPVMERILALVPVRRNLDRIIITLPLVKGGRG
ncbi:MAG TPA: hypothetical protein VH660_04245 [Candidatus Deferrimicrobiaceae bacterium]